jgi:hypothetical protein
VGTVEDDLRRDRAGGFCVRREEKTWKGEWAGGGGGGSLQGGNLGSVEDNLFRSLETRAQT